MKYLLPLVFIISFYTSKASAQEKDTVFVSTPQELMESIKSERVIIINSDHIQLGDETLVIADLYNLEITGNATDQVKITTGSTHKSVISIENSNNITFTNLSLGHWPDAGYCTGNVYDIFNCDSIRINNCDVFGSGVLGLNLDKANVWCQNTTIRECSENIINDIAYTRNILLFEECSFYLNPENKIYYPGARFENCRFYTADSTELVKNYYGFYPEEPVLIKSEVIAENPGWSELTESEYESVCPNTCTVETSSNLKAAKNITYNSQNLYQTTATDGKKNSAWVEGVDGDGIGEKVIFKVAEVYADYEDWRISGEFHIINGYTKNQQTWESNSRVKQFEVIRNNKIVALINLADSPNMQSFHLGDIVFKNHLQVGEILEFQITKVYKGDKYTDTAITYFVPACSP